MLEQILDFIHNYFVSVRKYGTFSIVEGALQYDGLLDGQYYKLEGSALNDGVHLFPDDELRDETFTGYVNEMNVPVALLSLAEEIDGWVDKYGDAALSPYTSEHFGNYSYTKGSGNRGNSQSGNISWTDVFRTRLNAYRKIS